jgi:hypothetical protein
VVVDVVEALRDNHVNYVQPCYDWFSRSIRGALAGTGLLLLAVAGWLLLELDDGVVVRKTAG